MSTTEIKSAEKEQPPRAAWRYWATRPGPWLPWAVALCSTLPFLPSLWAKFVMLDDDFNFLKNENFRGLGPANLKWMFFTFQLGGVYQPLAWMTHAVDYLLWGLSPAGFHLTNIVLISACALAMYFLAARVIRLAAGPGPADEAALRWSAAVSALFFAVHPMRVEVVAWASNRSYVLPALFYILALTAYLRAQEPRSGARSRWMAACTALFALSLLSKAIGMTLPIVLFILDYYPLRRIERLEWRRIIALTLEKTPVFVVAAAAAFMAAKGRVAFGAMVPVSKFGVPARLGQAFFGLSFYLEKMLFPVNLAPLYSLPPHLNPLDDLCLPRTAAVAAITLAAVALRRRQPWLLPAWAAHVVILAPFLGLSQYGLLLQIAADKWFLLGSIVWALVIGGIFLHFWKAAPDERRKLRLAQGCAGALALLALLSLRQAMTWHDTETLFLHNIAVEPDCYFCHNNLAVYYNDRKRFDTALAHAQQSLRIKPDYTLALANGAISYEGLGRFDEALSLVKREVASAPNDAEALFNLGYFYSRVGQVDEALAATKRALALSPNMTKAHNNMGYFLRQVGDFSEAQDEYQASLSIDAHQPGTPEALALAKKGLADKTTVEQARRDAAQGYQRAGMSAFQANRLDEAVSQMEAGVTFDPEDAQGRYNLGVALVQKGDIAAAAEQFREAARLKPDFSNAHFNLGFTLQSMGRPTEAEPHYRAATRLNPKAPNAFLNLGVLLTSQKRLDEAETFCAKAAKLDPSMANNPNCWRKAR